jgi:cytosine/adenosine deaminase-related metal-dependent hydrolase
VPIYLTNADYIDADTNAITRTAIRVDEGVGGGIKLIDKVPDGEDAIDCTGRIVTRSFVVGHHHIYSALARGMPGPKSPPSNFVEILEKIWWRLDKALDADTIRASALVAGVDAALCGTTFIIDHHASPNAPTDSLHIIADTLESIGLGHLLCYELSDRDGPERLEHGIAETERYLEHRQGLVGLHASFTVSDDLLDRAMNIACAHNTGIHVHVAEAESDQVDCLTKHGKRCVNRFADAGALTQRGTILAHCIHLDAQERELICDSQAWVSQQAESNLNNAVGMLDASAFAQRVFIGTDGMHGDMLAATRATYLASQSAEGLSPSAACQRLRRVHDYLARNNFAGDSDNNLVILNYQSPTPISPANWPTHIVYGLNRSHIETVISDGRVIVRDGRCTLVDEDTIYANAREQATRLWNRL